MAVQLEVDAPFLTGHPAPTFFRCASSQVTVHGKEEFTFPYVPSHLHHTLFELSKNSMRAVVEQHGPCLGAEASCYFLCCCALLL